MYINKNVYGSFVRDEDFTLYRTEYLIVLYYGNYLLTRWEY